MLARPEKALQEQAGHITHRIEELIGLGSARQDAPSDRVLWVTGGVVVVVVQIALLLSSLKSKESEGFQPSSG